MNDIKYAGRSFLKTPGFTAVVILTLALGVGATTAIFSVVNAVLLEPLPFANADRLVVARLSLPDYQDIKRATTSFDEMGVWATNLYNLKSGTDSQQVLGGVISRELMPLLGVKPILGRSFSVEDERQESVILGFGLWRSRFGGDPSVLGRSIDLSGNDVHRCRCRAERVQLPHLGVPAVDADGHHRSEGAGASDKSRPAHLQCDRAPQARRHCATGTGRSRRAKRNSRPHLSGDQSGRHRHARTAVRTNRRQRTSGSSGAVRDGRPLAADRLRERGEPHAREDDDARA